MWSFFFKALTYFFIVQKMCVGYNLSLLVHWLNHTGRRIGNELICFHLSEIHSCMLWRTGKYCHRADVNLSKKYLKCISNLVISSSGDDFKRWTRLLHSESKTIKLDMVVAMLMQTNLTFLNDNIDLFLKNAICFVPDSWLRSANRFVNFHSPARSLKKFCQAFLWYFHLANRSICAPDHKPKLGAQCHQ